MVSENDHIHESQHSYNKLKEDKFIEDNTESSKHYWKSLIRLFIGMMKILS